MLAQNSPLRLTEIAEATSLNKATTLRILGSLIEEGFVTRVAGAKTYELGQEARVMAISARRTVDIAELAQPSLLRLSERSADTALLSVRSGVEALYLARSVGSHPLQPNYLQIGSRRPLGVGAGSLALMVWLPDAEIDAIIDVIMPRLAKSPRITPKYLRERIVAARKHGHTVQVDVALPGMGGVGVPVRDDAGQVIAALSVGASSDRIRRREAELAEMLKKEAQILERAMAQPAKPGALKMIKASLGERSGAFVQRHQLALLAQRRQQRADQQHHGQRQTRRRDRPRHERHEVALREDQRLAQIVLQHRPEHERQHQRRRFITELAHEIADHAERDHDIDVEHVVAGAIDADDGEQDDQREQNIIRQLQQLDPHPDHRQIEHQQHHVADIHAGDDAPEQAGVLRDQ